MDGIFHLAAPRIGRSTALSLGRYSSLTDGNGRHSRLIADVMIAAAKGEELTWGSRGNLVSVGDARRRYIEAIEQADAGNFVPLLTFALR